MKAFIGAAGTGKTYRLMSEVEAWLSSNTLAEGQCVLALTRMHGARRRLVERLRSTSARQNFRCMTLDQFAWMIACRWRSLGAVKASHSVESLDYDATAHSAAVALRLDMVRGWISARYPLIVVDEFQDCHGGQLELVQELARAGDLFLAADGFQDLSKGGYAPAVSWLKEEGCVEELVTNHRTKMSGLLTAAIRIRGGEMIEKGQGLKILSARNANVGAKFLANEIHWSSYAELVVLSPTSPDRSHFIGGVLDRVSSGPFKDKHRSVGPYRVVWHGAMNARSDEVCRALGLPEEDSVQVELAELPAVDSVEGHRFAEWVAQKRRLGQSSYSAKELRMAVQRCIQQSRAWSQSPRGLWGTTVHGAKNREFARVVLLWPNETQSGEQAARLLYNGITRAKESAVIIVQDSDGKRLQRPPFSGWQKAVEVEVPKVHQLSLF